MLECRVAISLLNTNAYISKRDPTLMLQENQPRDTSCLLAGSVTTCNNDYTTFMVYNSPTDYDTMVSDCQAAVSALGPANTLLGNSNGASSAASALSALQTALGNLPSQQVSTSQYFAPNRPMLF